jgi:arginine deiminase
MASNDPAHVDKLHVDQQKAAEAESLLKNEMLTGIYLAKRQALIDEWIATASEETQRRDDCWRSIKLLDNQRQQLKLVALTGKASAKELLHIKKESLLKKVMR